MGISEVEKFAAERKENISRLGNDVDLKGLSRIWQREVSNYNYIYNFSWLGRPIIQYPQDMMAMQEILWEVKPDLVIETGIAHGGSLMFYASMLELNAACGGPQDAKVLGIDIDIRSHNRQALEEHPMFKRIDMIQGSSVSEGTISQVKEYATGKDRVLVTFDSNHTHDHVLAELRAYAPLVTVGSYCVVFDTAVEEMPAELFHDRPWGPGNSPKSAVLEYLNMQGGFEIDESITNKIQITVAPGGYLKRIK